MRDYKNNYKSVTEVLGLLRKPALEYWFKNNSLQFIQEESAKGRQIGTQVHDLIEQYISGKTPELNTIYETEVRNVAEGFVKLLKEHPDWKFKASEVSITNVDYRINGTIDAIVECGENRFVADWKTGKAKDKDAPEVYTEYVMQASAYDWLFNENLLKLGSNPINFLNHPPVIISLAKDKVGYAMREVGRSEMIMARDAFKSLLFFSQKYEKFLDKFKITQREGAQDEDNTQQFI